MTIKIKILKTLKREFVFFIKIKLMKIIDNKIPAKRVAEKLKNIVKVNNKIKKIFNKLIFFDNL